MKKTFLFICVGGDFLSIHQRIAEEGYDCISWYSPDTLKGKGSTGKGLIETVPDLFDVLFQFKEKKEDLVILIDDNGHGDLCTYLKSEGWHIVGSSKFADLAEHSRDKGNEIAKQIGLSIPPTEHFTEFKPALEYLERIKLTVGPDTRFVFKGDGVDLAGSSKTYVAKSVDDMVWYVGWIEKDQGIHNYTVDSFELQLVIDGIEVDFASWFNGSQFINNVSVCFEQKRIHGLGAAQGCMGQVVTFVPATSSNYFSNYLSKLEPILKREGQANEWAINNIVGIDDKKPYFLEFTPRFGWDSTFGELAILQDSGRSIAEFFINLAFQKPFPKGFFPTGKFSAAARLFSEAPGVKADCVTGKPVTWEKSIEKNLWWYGIRRRDDGRCEVTDNPIGVATFVADTPEGAIEGLYQMIDPNNLMITHPDLFYSETIGEKVVNSLSTLSSWETI